MESPLLRSHSCKINEKQIEYEKMYLFDSNDEKDEGSTTYDKTNFKFKKYKSESDVVNQKKEKKTLKIFKKKRKISIKYGRDSNENLEYTQYVLLMIFFFVLYLILHLFKIHQLILVFIAFILSSYIFRSNKNENEINNEHSLLNISEIEEKKDNSFDEFELSQSLLNI